MFAISKILVDLPKISSKVSFIIASRRGVLEKYLLQTLEPKNEMMEQCERERVENQVA
jgi:hypothetical protein